MVGVALRIMITKKSSRWFVLIIQINKESHPKRGWRCLDTVLTLSGVALNPSWCQGHSFSPTNLVCTLFTNDGGEGNHSRSSADFRGRWAGLDSDWECFLEDIHLPRWLLVPPHEGRTNPSWGCRVKRSLTALVRCGQSFSGVDRSLVSCPWSRTPAQDGDQPIKGEEQGLRTQELKCVSKTEATKSLGTQCTSEYRGGGWKRNSWM